MRVKQVQKRDGRTVDFDHTLICRAITKAMQECGYDNKECAYRIAHEIAEEAEKDTLAVEEIQDTVERKLMASMPDVARAYILYRDKRNKARHSTSDQVITDIIAAKKNDVTRENANMNADTPAGMMMKIASERSKEYVDEYLLSEPVRKAVKDNILHIHDKDYYPSKALVCLHHPMNQLFKDGFNAGHGASRAPKRIETASILTCISLESIQNEMEGGQAIPAFDFYLAPYVRATYEEEIQKIATLGNVALDDLKDIKITDYTYRPLAELEDDDRLVQHAINMTVDRVHQSMEAFIHNMNTISSRGGNQVVFSSINYGTDISAEGRCIIRELLKSTYRGVGNGATAIFPIQIWKKKRGVNYLPGDPNYDLYQMACMVTAKRFFPNFINLDAPYNQHEKWTKDDPKRYKYETATMGCVDGQEIVTYTYNNKLYVEPFKNMWKRLSGDFTIQESTIEGYADGQFMDLSGVQIADKDNFVDCYRIIKNPDHEDWVVVTLSNGRALTVTSDHPWSVKNKGVILTKDLSLDDEIELVDIQQKGIGCDKYISKYVAGFEPLAIHYGRVTKIVKLGYRNQCSYDVTTASEHFNVSGVRSHNCRTRVFENRHGEKTSIGRGCLSFSTINLPGLALSVMHEPREQRMRDFMAKLDAAIDVTAQQLLERYQFQCTALAKQFPLLMSGMWVGSDKLTPNDEVGEVLKQGTLGIGFIGLAECLMALIGKHHGESEEAQDIGLIIIQHMKERIDGLSQIHNLNFSVLATPAESLSGRFVKKDKLKYGIIPGVTDRDYYTNSNHVPVYYKCSAAHKARIEAPYHPLTRGGHIFYVELDGDATHNVQAVMDVVGLMDQYNIGYGSINHNRNRCLDCSYEDASKDLKVCPKCGSTRIDRLQRITGYLVGTTDRWNSGKRAELDDRVTHD